MLASRCERGLQRRRRGFRPIPSPSLFFQLVLQRVRPGVRVRGARGPGLGVLAVTLGRWFLGSPRSAHAPGRGVQQRLLRLLELVAETSRGFVFRAVRSSNRRLCARQLRGQRRFLVRQRGDALGGGFGGGVGVSRALLELPVPRPELLLFRVGWRRRRRRLPTWPPRSIPPRTSRRPLAPR